MHHHTYFIINFIFFNKNFFLQQNIHFHESIEKEKVTPSKQFCKKFVKMADDDDIIIVEENGETPKKKHVTVGFTIENQPGKE